MTAPKQTDRSGIEAGPQNYMPGMPRLSRKAGVVEEFLTTLFRRRGTMYVLFTRSNRPR
jgi:hypothetical protein